MILNAGYYEINEIYFNNAQILKAEYVMFNSFMQF